MNHQGVIILGGGISGLSTVWKHAQLDCPPAGLEPEYLAERRGQASADQAMAMHD